MDIKKILQRRRGGETVGEEVLGKAGEAKAALLWKNNREIFADIEGGLLLRACEYNNFSSEELKIFKVGLRSVGSFFQECEAQHRLKLLSVERQKDIKEMVPNF